jgi:abnormal spindle-like microcephaly-associated protein
MKNHFKVFSNEVFFICVCIFFFKERDKAARIIQSAVIKFLNKQRFKKEVNAALVIQKYWRRFLAQRKLLMLKREKLEVIQNKSASVIQV